MTVFDLILSLSDMPQNAEVFMRSEGDCQYSEPQYVEDRVDEGKPIVIIQGT